MEERFCVCIIDGYMSISPACYEYEDCLSTRGSVVQLLKEDTLPRVLDYLCQYLLQSRPKGPNCN